ncbi:MAG: hypothetical protein ACTSQF_03490 [Candidatus Heimdallarchaeaceae archaeon]
MNRELSAMLYKLYKARNKTAGTDFNESYRDFIDTYKKYDVQVVGGGSNIDDSHEMYIMIAYKDEKHYKETVEKLKSDSTYIEQSKKLHELRESIDVVTLESSF